MKNPIGTLGAAAAGALAMYYLDPDLGARRRALLVELVQSGLPGERRPQRGQRWLGRGAYHRLTRADPQSDAELRDRIQEGLDRMVSHPRAIIISVENGVVRLSGHVLAKERDGLLEQVRQIAGVQKLVNAMTAHDHPQEFASNSDAELAPAPLAI
jgi:Predicted periplasmic or secreted lipoprotein